MHPDRSNTSQELPPIGHPHIPAMIRNAARDYASNIALSVVLPTGAHHSLTFAEVDALSDAFAVYLRKELALAPGSRVAVQMPNSLAYAVTAFGALKAACVLVNINPLYTPYETEAQIKDAEASVLILIDLFADRISSQTIQSLDTIIVASVVDFFPPTKRKLIQLIIKYVQKKVPKVHYRHRTLHQAVRKDQAQVASCASDLEQAVDHIDRDTLAMLQYTGGTTGKPKGVMLSHGNILANVKQSLIRAGDKLTPGQEISLTALPLYHIFAFSINLLGMFQAGGHSVLIPSPRPIDNLRPAFGRYAITWMSGVNRLFEALLDAQWFQTESPKYLKATVTGGMALDARIAERWEAVTRCPIAEGYGLTEASPSVAATPFSTIDRRRTVGLPLPGTKVELRDREGKPVGIGQPGELYVAGPQVMRGYWKRPEETAAALQNGWLATGDIASIDESGFIRIIDRIKDVINVGGFNVYPSEVECCLLKMRQIVDAAVIASGSASNQQVKAVIIPSDDKVGEEAVLAHCRAHLTGYKVPKLIEFRSELPRSAVGKVLKKRLKAEPEKAV